MIDGLALSIALLTVSGGGATSAVPQRAAAAPFAVTFERLPSAGASWQPVEAEQARPVWRAPRFSSSQPPAAPKRFTKTDRIIAVAAGVAAGWFGGGAIGYYSTANYDNPDDDTSGLKGLMIGAPIGAAVGGIVGYWLTNR